MLSLLQLELEQESAPRCFAVAYKLSPISTGPGGFLCERLSLGRRVH